MAAAEGTRRRPGRPRGRDGQAVGALGRRGRPGPAGKGGRGEQPRRGVRARAAGVPAGLGKAFFEPIEAAAPRAPDPGLINEDFQPTLAADRTFSAADMAALWVGLVVCVPTWYLAGGLVEMGMSWLQGIATVSNLHGLGADGADGTLTTTTPTFRSLWGTSFAWRPCS